MRRLLPLLLFVFTLPALASLFDSRPASTLGAPLNNSSDFLPVEQAFRLDLVDSSPGGVRLRFTNAEGYYLYRHRLSFTAEPATVALQVVELPPGQAKQDEFFGDVEVYYGLLDVELRHNDQQPFTLRVGYQGCADLGLCYPPETRELQIGSSGAASALDWHSIALFFLGGLALTFTPCVLPMLPILGGVVLRGEIGGLRGLVLSTAYVLPMALCFALLGALMGLFGAELNLQARLQSPWVLVPFAAFFGVFALAMFGLFELRLPHWLSAPLDRLAGNTRGGSVVGAALLGVCSSLLVSPCVSAPLAGALLYISASGDALGGGLKLFALGLGMGTPLILFATGGGALLPRGGQWMLTVRNTFGVLLLAVAIWLLERVLPGALSLLLWGLLTAGVALFLGALELTPKSPRQKMAQLVGLLLLCYALAAWFGALQGHSDPLRPLGNLSADSAPASSSAAHDWQTIDTPEALDSALAAARSAGQKVALDWYADWCVSCKVIEREVFSQAEVQQRLQDWRLLRFDITASNPAQRALLDRYQLFGPPAIQLIAGNGEEWQDLRVVGEVDAAAFSQRLDQANARR